MFNNVYIFALMQRVEELKMRIKKMDLTGSRLVVKNNTAQGSFVAERRIETLTQESEIQKGRVLCEDVIN